MLDSTEFYYVHTKSNECTRFLIQIFRIHQDSKGRTLVVFAIETSNPLRNILFIKIILSPSKQKGKRVCFWFMTYSPNPIIDDFSFGP